MALYGGVHAAGSDRRRVTDSGRLCAPQIEHKNDQIEKGECIGRNTEWNVGQDAPFTQRNDVAFGVGRFRFGKVSEHRPRRPINHQYEETGDQQSGQINHTTNV